VSERVCVAGLSVAVLVSERVCVAGLSVAVLVSERLGVGYRYDLEPYLGKVVMFICMCVWVRLSVTSS
jgi:hypothetical protein